MLTQESTSAQPLSDSVPLVEITPLVKRQKYMADKDYFIPGAIAVPSLLHGQCNNAQKVIWKISYI